MSAMWELRRFLLLVISLWLFHVASCQVFHFPNGVKYDSSCAMEGESTWTVQGTVQLSPGDLDMFQPNVAVRINSQQLCSIDLTACETATSQKPSDSCYCTGKEGSVYSLYVSRRPRASESGLMLQAAMTSRDDLNPTTVSSNIGPLPHVNQNAATATYQVDTGIVHSLDVVQNITVPRNKLMTFTFCVGNLQSALLKIQVNEQEKTASSACVTETTAFDFAKADMYKLEFSYEEKAGCSRSETFTLYVKEREHDVITVEKTSCTGVSPYFPAKLPNGTCGKHEFSCPREVVTLSNGQRVPCDTDSDGGGWVVIQRRASSDVDFYRGWSEYVNGFGDLDGNLWFGLEKIHRLCGQQASSCELRVDLKYNGSDYFAHYDTFNLSDATQFYVLHVNGYHGNAGDGLTDHGGYHDNVPFSTFDSDHDGRDTDNCAIHYHSGWWHNHCHWSNLNGIWGSKDFGMGLNWEPLSTYYDSVTFSEMKVRPRA